MATQNLVEQVIVFISNTESFDQNAIFSSSLLQSLASNSAGGDIEYGYKQYANWNGSVWTYSSLLELRCYVLPSFVATIQSNIANLQSAFPQYTIATWGGNVVFGN